MSRPNAPSIVLALVLFPPAALAGADAVPEYSTVDSALTVCPAGDFVFHAIARILPGVLSFRTWYIDVDITDCSELRLGTLPSASGVELVTYGGHHYLQQFCNPFGSAQFGIPAGGIATGRTLSVVESHGGVVLATRSTLLSPDQNGDLIVDEADVALAAGKLGTSDPTADFDFDGTVTHADLAILEEHLGHQDPLHVAPTPTQPLTWGRVKSLYRGR